MIHTNSTADQSTTSPPEPVVDDIRGVTGGLAGGLTGLKSMILHNTRRVGGLCGVP